MEPGRMSWPVRHELGQALPPEVLRMDWSLCVIEAVLWGLRHADAAHPETCLRTEELKPYLFNDNRYQSVHDVVYARHQALRRENVVPYFDFGARIEDLADLPGLLPPRLGGGRLLVWDRDATVDDGIGMNLTGEYLDMSDMPPWDTWVAYLTEVQDPATHNLLVSWVPADFVEPVGRAIEMSVCGTLYWLGDKDFLITRVLRDGGLLA